MPFSGGCGCIAALTPAELVREFDKFINPDSLDLDIVQSEKELDFSFTAWACLARRRKARASQAKGRFAAASYILLEGCDPKLISLRPSYLTWLRSSTSTRLPSTVLVISPLSPRSPTLIYREFGPPKTETPSKLHHFLNSYQDDSALPRSSQRRQSSDSLPTMDLPSFKITHRVWSGQEMCQACHLDWHPAERSTAHAWPQERHAAGSLQLDGFRGLSNRLAHTCCKESPVMSAMGYIQHPSTPVESAQFAPRSSSASSLDEPPRFATVDAAAPNFGYSDAGYGFSADAAGPHGLRI